MKLKLDWKQLKKRCQRSTTKSFDLLKEQGGTIEGKGEQRHGFLDRGPNSKVLAVAHLDWVEMGGFWFDVAKVKDNNWCACPRLDDRLGVYTILDFLPSVGIEVDVLLTEGEEIGRSTASHFWNEKEYNWIVEFDRKGTDVVTYCYEWNDVLKQYFDIGHGSYSDIADMEYIGVNGLNIGVGYHGEHTEYCFFVAEEWFLQMRRFMKFYEENKDKKFIHTESFATKRTLYGFSHYDNYSEQDLRDLETLEKAEETGDISRLESLWIKDDIREGRLNTNGLHTTKKKKKKKKKSTSTAKGKKDRKKKSKSGKGRRDERPTEELHIDRFKDERGIGSYGDMEICPVCEAWKLPGWYLRQIGDETVWAPCPKCNAEALDLAEGVK